MSNSSPSLSLILLTYNGGPTLARTLAAIFGQEQGVLPALEVVAIDSGSRDATLETLRQYPVTLHQISQREFGHGRTRNLGARLAQGEWLIYLSQDAVPAHARWLANLTRHLHDPQVAAAFSRQLPPPGVGPIETYFLEQTYPPQAMRHDPLQAQAAGEPSIRRIFFSNVSAAIKKSVWAKCPFPENLVMSEDQAFARAALQAGYSLVYDPEAAVYHGHRYTLKQLFQRNFDSGYSLQAVTGDSWGAVAKMGAQYVWGEVRYLWRTGHMALIPYALLYAATKSAGFALGKSGHRLPAAWRPHFSLHKNYWQG